jgi:hypothetical protein
MRTPRVWIVILLLGCVESNLAASNNKGSLLLSSIG